MFKNLKHAFLRFLSIKSIHQLYPLKNKSQEISNSKNQIIIVFIDKQITSDIQFYNQELLIQAFN